jgi:hypothetical protein
VKALSSLFLANLMLHLSFRTSALDYLRIAAARARRRRLSDAAMMPGVA